MLDAVQILLTLQVYAMRVAYLREHGFEAGSGLGVQAPSHISRSALQILLTLPSAHLLSLLYEGMIGGSYSFEEKVVAIQELAVALQQVHGDGQHAPQDVGKTVPQLHHKHVSEMQACIIMTMILIVVITQQWCNNNDISDHNNHVHKHNKNHGTVSGYKS